MLSLLKTISWKYKDVEMVLSHYNIGSLLSKQTPGKSSHPKDFLLTKIRKEGASVCICHQKVVLPNIPTTVVISIGNSARV